MEVYKIITNDFVVEPKVENNVSNVNVSVENESVADVLILSFLQDEKKHILSNTKHMPYDATFPNVF